MTGERDRIAVELWRFVFTQLTEDAESAATCPPNLRDALVDSPPEVFAHMADALMTAGCRMPEPPHEVPGACNRVMARATATRCCLTPGHDGGCW